MLNRFVKIKSVHLLPKSNQKQETLELQVVITTHCKSRIEFHYFEVTQSAWITHLWHSDNRSNLNLEMIFVEGRKQENPDKNPQNKGKNCDTESGFLNIAVVSFPSESEKGRIFFFLLFCISMS